MAEKVHEGSGNVFADLGLPDPKVRQAKALIALHLEQLIEEAGWTQVEAAERMKLSQPDVSNIVNGRLSGFTLDRLLQCLDALDEGFEIRSKSRRSADAQEKVLVPYT